MIKLSGPVSLLVYMNFIEMSLLLSVKFAGHSQYCEKFESCGVWQLIKAYKILSFVWMIKILATILGVLLYVNMWCY